MLGTPWEQIACTCILVSGLPFYIGSPAWSGYFVLVLVLVLILVLVLTTATEIIVVKSEEFWRVTITAGGGRKDKGGCKSDIHGEYPVPCGHHHFNWDRLDKVGRTFTSLWCLAELWVLSRYVHFRQSLCIWTSRGRVLLLPTCISTTPLLCFVANTQTNCFFDLYWFFTTTLDVTIQGVSPDSIQISWEGVLVLWVLVARMQGREDEDSEESNA